MPIHIPYHLSQVNSSQCGAVDVCIWNEREKNLELVMRNTSQLFDSIKSIARNAIGPVQSLEFPMNSLE
ncbi:MAG: hypothetical protein KBH07_07715 [Flavobacteriales bacterium]|nr:hypothetical protein [Flavobacteriales bacterium]MBP9079751.1 hypothetical protein [Flavobacteriales bacterium]